MKHIGVMMGTSALIEIDGAEKSGSGTLVRFAAALCTLTGQALHMVNIRAKRDKPGLRPQHLKALTACASLCSGRLEGASVGSREITYYPGTTRHGGSFHWDIVTAGSATMLAFTILPPALFAGAQSLHTIRGGLFQDFAPSAFHMQRVLLPLLAQMGASARLEIVRPGYVPRGNGELSLSVEPMHGPLRGLDKIRRGSIRKISGISLASHLERERVAERMAERCRTILAERGYRAEIAMVNDSDAVQKGAALLVWAETETGCLMGFDGAGKRGRRSEAIAEHVAGAFCEEFATDATFDRFAADQIILFAALAEGRSQYVIPRLTGHMESNLWLIRKILGAGVGVQGNRITIDGIGFFGK